MKYVLMCRNQTCPVCDIPVQTPPYKMKYDKRKGKMVPYLDTPEVCSICGEPLRFIEKETTIPEFGVNGFKSLPDDKKREILRKRFDKDMRTGGSEEKEMRKRSAMNKFLGHDN